MKPRMQVIHEMKNSPRDSLVLMIKRLLAWKGVNDL